MANGKHAPAPIGSHNSPPTPNTSASASQRTSLDATMEPVNKKIKLSTTDEDVASPKSTKNQELEECASTEQNVIQHAEGEEGAQHFRFLDLPGELRNLVYELVLTSDHDVGATVPTNHPSNPSLLNADDIIVIGKLILEVGQAGVPSPAKKLNQLKYVCRQLRKETAGIEIKYNTITFADTHRAKDFYEDRAAEAFLAFTRICSPDKLKWLKKITIDDRKTGTYFPTQYLANEIGQVLGLLNFCKAHPDIKIDVIVPKWCIEIPPTGFQPLPHLYKNKAPHHFIMTGAYISEIFRGVNLEFLLTARKDPEWARMKNLRTQPLLEHADCNSVEDFQGVDNLRFHAAVYNNPAVWGYIPWNGKEFRRYAEF